jgi:ATP-binding cassette subfamily B multidrug efflux pump
MHGDFGYMEEGKLGKPYNIRLLKRLSHYTLPYKKVVFMGLLLAIITALFDLTLPYFSKIAIDRYILSSWYRVDLKKIKTTKEKDFTNRYGRFVEKSEDGGWFDCGFP